MQVFDVLRYRNRKNIGCVHYFVYYSNYKCNMYRVLTVKGIIIMNENSY